MKPAIALWRAEVVRLVRDMRFVVLTLGLPVIFYVIFIDEAGPAARIDGTAWASYFMVSMAAFGVVGSSVSALSVRLSAERKGGWVRWLRTTPLSSTGYALAKVMTQLTLVLLDILVIFLLAHFYQHVDLAASRWLAIGAWLWLASLPFAALGVLIGMFGTAAQVLGTLVYMLLSLLGGLWTPISQLPTALQNVARWLPTYRYGAPAWSILAGGSVPLRDVAILFVYAIIFVAAAAIVQRRVDAQASG
ncbi:MAG: ABC transporter permease [Firmicutes bacterium]|nr:ABC transporter permease [Bacillota bacterium]